MRERKLEGEKERGGGRAGGQANMHSKKPFSPKPQSFIYKATNAEKKIERHSPRITEAVVRIRLMNGRLLLYEW